MRKSTFLISLSSFVILGLMVFIFIVGVNSENHKKLQVSYASLEPVIRQIAVIDMNQLGSFTPAMVLSERLPILAIHMSSNPHDHSKDLLNFLDVTGPLTHFDLHNSNRIDSTDNIYSHLELVYLRGNKVSSIISIADASILSIYIDKGRLKLVSLSPNGPKGYWNIVNTAFLADGSKRTMRVLPMNSTDLPPLSS